MGSASSVSTSESQPYSNSDSRSQTASSSSVRMNNAVDKDNTARPQRSSAQTAVSTSPDVVFETYYNRQGRSMTVMRRGSVRFYLDMQSGDWREFPAKWINEGIFVEEDRSNIDINVLNIPKLFDENVQLEHNVNREQQARKDDREGYLVHQERGRLLTYIFEHRRHVHCYYDMQQHAWIKLPTCWELKVELIKGFMDSIQRQCPEWTDREDILACLRASNYNVEDCVATYFVVKDWLGLQRSSRASASSTSLSVNNQLRSKDESSSENKQLREQLAQLKVQWTTAIKERDAAVSELQRYKSQQGSGSNLAAAAAAGGGIAAAMQSNKLSNEQKAALARVQRTLEALRTERAALSQQLQQEHQAIGKLLHALQQALAQLQSRVNEASAEMNELRANYEREALERKLLYNQFQEIRGNIRVFARVRRTLAVDEHAGEKDDEGKPLAKAGSHMRFLSDTEIKVRIQGFDRTFRFDHVLEPNVSQQQVYEQVSPIITSCADGYNVCILAYGQTGSGKTFTMEGTKDNEGVCPRAISELLNVCRDRESIKYTFKMSALEIYNESIQDLLSSEASTVEIRSKDSSVQIAGLTEMNVQKQEDILQIMKLATQNRKVASTKMNSQSSRSHLIIALRIVGENKLTGTTTTAWLQMCDLAGSERASKTQAEGARLAEAGAINKSLMTLGQVFQALKNSQMHVPYRNSKLTHALQPCLSGEAKVVLIATISPDVMQLQETVNTLQFAANCCQIALGPAKQNIG